MRTRTTGSVTLAAAVAAIGVLLASADAFGHGGGLDKSGGHTNRKTGEYHCHRCPCGCSTPKPGASPVPSGARSPAGTPTPDDTLSEEEWQSFRDGLVGEAVRKKPGVTEKERLALRKVYECQADAMISAVKMQCSTLSCLKSSLSEIDLESVRKKCGPPPG